MWPFNRRAAPDAERRSTLSIQVPQSSPEILAIFGMAHLDVTDMDILGLPAVMAARTFLSGTIAGLPLHVYHRQSDGQKKRVAATKANPVVVALHDAANDGLTSFQWRFDMFSSGVLTDGRDVTYIERDGQNRVVNLWPLPGATVKRLDNGRLRYTHEGGGKTVHYDQAEVIDVTFMRQRDRLGAVSPISQCRTALAKAAAANGFGAKLFENGGMPPYALQGPFDSKEAATRAGKDVEEATKSAAEDGRKVLAIPTGHKLEALGSDPEKMQMVEVLRFMVEEVARVYSLPPVFLQDLTHGTFSNTEQQDLHFVKHTLKRWVEQLEQELTLKLFGRHSPRFVEFNLDGLLRGDFTTRMEGWATAIQNGIRTPDEVRGHENLPPMPGGDRLYIQGATVPLTKSGQDGAENGAEDGGTTASNGDENDGT